MADWAAIEAELTELLADQGYELVAFEPRTSRSKQILVRVDRLDEPGSITVDECADLSRLIGGVLDDHDPIAGSYRLQVSSPGVDRPLTKLAHCRQFAGQVARIKYRRVGQTQTVQGRLRGVAADDPQAVVLEVDGERLIVPWTEVVKANLVYDWGD